MFSGFYIDLDEKIFVGKSLKQYSKKGKNHLREAKQKYDIRLDKYEKEGMLSASLIEQDWFPEIDADVFISHSHFDEGLVEVFVGWLYETFGLKCFLDSHVWNHANSLIALLDQRYSDPITDDTTTYYSYTKSNKVCEHANMMLAVALQKMIDKTESLFFVNTVNASSLLNGNAINETYSPWIYTELVCANIVRKKPLLAYRSYKNKIVQKRQNDTYAMLEYLQISYPLNLKRLDKLDVNKLSEWERRNSNGNYEYPMDALYEITGYESALNKAKAFSDHATGVKLEQIQRLFSGAGKEEYSELQVLMESEGERCPFPYGKCPIYARCRCCCYERCLEIR